MGGGTCISGVLETVENCSPSQIDFYYNFQSHVLREYGICTILEQSVISLGIWRNNTQCYQASLPS